MTSIFRTAPATAAIAVLTVVVSLIVTFSGYDGLWSYHAGFIPARVTYGLAPGQTGFLPLALTPLSSALIHGGILHLGFNLVTFLYCGKAAEKALGTRGLIVLYVLGAYAACAAQYLASPEAEVPMIGASGAVSAIVGAYSLLYGRNRARDLGPVPAWLVHVLWLLAAWTVLNLAVGFLSARSGTPIAAAAHVGGFIAGLVLCRPLLMWNWRHA
ncbi:rhomboid family intramembrane serine protease [Sphingomonas sp. RS2018]